MPRLLFAAALMPSIAAMLTAAVKADLHGRLDGPPGPPLRVRVVAQGRAGAAAQVTAASPRAGAPVDLTGTWVSVVTEDWRWRMVTPPKGDFTSVPLNEEGRKVAESWDPATDGSCRAYGAAAITSAVWMI